MEYEYRDEKGSHTVRIESRKETVEANIDGVEISGDLFSVASNGLSVCIADRPARIWYAQKDDVIFIHCDGHVFKFHTGRDGSDFQHGSRSDAESRTIITAPMPGSVLKVCKREGESVEEGECLAILEAMKMETELFARIPGTLKRCFVKAGEQVDAGQPIVEVDPKVSAAKKA